MARTHSRFERCWELGYPVTYDQLRDRRVGLVALACVDLAIWDAIGKALGVPLWQLWGGYRDTIPANIIGGYYGRDLAGIRDEVAEWREHGLPRLQVQGRRTHPVEDAERVDGRARGGRGRLRHHDRRQPGLHACRWRSSSASASRDLDIRWFEEPCIWANDRRDMREVRARGGIPVCAGQSEHSPEACRDLMETGAIDVCNFDASWSGGYTNWRRMAAAAHLYSVQLAHHEEPQVAAHLLASQPHGTYVEVFHPDRDPIWWNILAQPPRARRRADRAPIAAGFGWVLDGDFIERYRVDRG